MRYVCPAILLGLSLGAPTAVTAQTLSITNYQAVSQQVATSTQWYLTYRADVINNGPALGSVTATLSSTNLYARALQGMSSLNFANVPANSQITSTNTFTILSSSTTLNPSDLQWTFQTTAAGPIANAGPNQTAGVGSTVTLNGSASTTPSGNLSYSWRFSSRPSGSSTVLMNWTNVMPSFVVDVAGTFVVTLTVSNGTATSTANVTISTTATPPVANAGANQTVAVGSTALLNGSGSSDIDGNPLTYSWTITNSPAGSAATLTGPSTVSPSFVVDKAGSYTVQLIVHDGSISSVPSNVTITTSNSPPVANAGPGQSVSAGTTVHLDGSASSDIDGNPLTYQWSLITVPTGSSAALNSTTAIKPTFTADLTGTYIAQLIVNDGLVNSSPATVTITTIAVLPPTANPGSNQTVATGTVVSLNGSGTDPQSLQLTFHWSLTTRPANSSAALSSPTIANPTFSADLPGTYVAQLIVNNGTLNSSPATVTITASAQSGLQLPSNVVAAPGQSIPLNVTLGSPAPANGLYVTLASSDPTKVTVTAVIMIPSGATAPTTTPKVNGVAFGSATITASASSYPPATGSVQVTESLSFSPPSLSMTAGAKQQLYLFIAAPAPAGGVTINLSSSNPGVATVPQTVTIGSGFSSVNVPVTGISAGSTTVQASGVNLVATTANVTVNAVVVASGPPTITVMGGGAQSASVSTAFSAPLVVVVTDASSNPISGVTVTFSAPASLATGTFSGGVNTAITNASGIATSAIFTANGNTGTYQVTASAPGTVTPAVFRFWNIGPQLVGTPSTPTPGVGQPGTPVNFQCSIGTGAGADTQVNLIWDRADDSDTSMVVSRATSSGGPYTPITLTAHSNLFNDTSAYPATVYYYKVHASNGNGNSVDGGPIHCTTLPSQANTFSGAAGFTVTNSDSWTNTLTWTDPNPSGFRYWVVQYSLDGVRFQTVNPLIGATLATGYVHPSLVPGTTYYYRARVQNNAGGYSDWTAPVSSTTVARPSGYPLELTNFSCVVNSATQTVCSWTDTNSGAASVKVETSAFNNMSPSFSQVAQVPAGATSFVLTTTPETFYYIRVRPSNAVGNGGYTPVVKIRTASAGRGTPQTYNICPSGCTYSTIGASPIATGLGPGDTVNIGAGTYHEAFLLSNRGTAAAPININCAAGAYIDGINAVVASASQFNSPQYENDLAIISIGRRNSQSSSGGWSPGYINLTGCGIQNAVNGGSYTLASVGTRTYIHPSCVYMFEGDHINLAGNTIHGCSNGIFGAGNDDTRNLEAIQIGVCPTGNYIYGNGEPGGTLYHNIYLEGIGMIYECNKFGDLVATASSAACVGMKDRSAGAIFRYNKVVTATQQGEWIIFGEAQNYSQFTTVNPQFNSIQVYGNDFEDTTGAGTSSSPVWFAFGYPGSYLANGRSGPYLFYDNNITLQSNRTTIYHASLFDTQVAVSTVDVRNNIIWNGASPGDTPSHIYLMGYQSGRIAHFGSNWISSGYYNCNEFQTCSGILGGGSAIVNNGASNNPGFSTSPTNATFNLTLTSGGQVVGLGGVLGGNWPIPTEQYAEPYSGTVRQNINDLGAYQ